MRVKDGKQHMNSNKELRAKLKALRAVGAEVLEDKSAKMVRVRYNSHDVLLAFEVKKGVWVVTHSPQLFEVEG